MSLRWNGIVQRKLALLDQQVMKIEGYIGKMTREQFSQDWAARTLSERAIQVCAEIMIDVAERIIALAGAGPTATAAEAVDKLVQLKVLSQPEPYRSMVRMRNIIVHGYEEVNPDVLYDVVTNRLGDFRQFRDEIDKANAQPERL